LQDFGYSVNTWATYLIDLSLSEEQLIANLDKAGRKQIRKANEQGLTVKKISTKIDFFSEFVEPYLEFELSAGRIPPTRESFLVMWEKDNDNYYSFFSVKDKQGNIIGVLGGYSFNGVATEITSAVHPSVYSEHLAAQDILHWEMIQYFRGIGISWFNLAGINPDPQTPKEKGIRQFKAKWGGVYTPYFRYSKQYPTTIQKLARLISKPKTKK
jgi:lipid II:glycine glycyltransferase (peptidoglycan interpeptide bridge formation enzyme)